MMTMAKIMKQNQDAGGHWFDKSTIRFFSSRISGTVYPLSCAPDRAALFVSSERYRDAERRYTVRVAAGGLVGTVGKFQQFSTLPRANSKARWLAMAIDKLPRVPKDTQLCWELERVLTERLNES